MKSIFDNVSFDCSVKVTKAYSTSFSSAVKMLAPSIRQDIYNIYGFVRFAEEIGQWIEITIGIVWKKLIGFSLKGQALRLLIQ